MSRETDTRPAPRAAGAKSHETMLVETGKALRAMTMYPAGHPQRSNILEQVYKNVRGSMSGLSEASFQVGASGFTTNGEAAGANYPVTSELAKEMHLRQVKSFSLKNELTLEDLTAFLELLMQDPEKFRKGRFIEEWIKTREMRTIWINEIDFQRLASLASSEIEEEEEDTKGPGQADLNALLDRLDAERDPDMFKDLLREAELMVQVLAENDDYRRAWVVLATVSTHATEDLRPGPEGERIRALAMASVRSMARGDLLERLLLDFTETSGSDTVPYVRVFGQAGPAVIDAAIGIISRREAMMAYRPLMKLILDHGTEARPILEQHLEGQSPVRLRKALFLLGELGSRQSVEKIRTFILHDDPRVKREAVRALTRIKGMEASRALVSALQAVDGNETRTMIVNHLGESRDLAAAPALLNLLKSTPVRDDTMELLAAIIEALGAIGSREALPRLIKLLHKRPLLNREQRNELRIKAAEALGRLGGESALQALAKYARGGDDPISRACARVMEDLLEEDKSGEGEA